MNEIIEVETIYDGWSKCLLAHVRLEDGTIVKRQIEDHGNAVVVLAYDPERRCATLIRQSRGAVMYSRQKHDLLECIAGILDEDDPAAAARREASEETGLALGQVEHLGRYWSMPGISTERSDMFLAVYSESDRTGKGGGLAEEHEDITILEMPLVELAAMADKGEIQDLKVFALLQTLRLRRPELFGREEGQPRFSPREKAATLPSQPKTKARPGKKQPK
jgi:nudix-type nucleoside diphosphatase (YffH/AdpP family)